MKCLTSISEQEYLIMTAFSSFSLLTYLIFIFFLIKKSVFKDFCSRIVIYLSALGALRSLFKALQFPSTVKNPTFCSLIAYFTGATNFSSIMWSISISISIYDALINHEYNYFKHHSKWLILNFFIVPVLFALPLISESYSEYKGICFLANNQLGNILGILLSTLPNIVMVVVGIILYWRIWNKMRKFDDECALNILFARGYVFIIITVITLLPVAVICALNLVIDICLSSSVYVLVECWISFNAAGNVIGYFAYEKIRMKYRQRSLERPFNSSSIFDKEVI